jgi:NTP pyrophosphatase (non-canonical NTP hydrolase)
MGSLSDHILKTVGATLATEYLPNVVKDHERLGLFLSIFLMGAVAEEFERAAHRRIEENNALRKIFLQSLPVIEDQDLKSRLRKAAGRTEDDYRVAALDKLNCELQEALIDLHSHVETLEGDGARAIEKTIWRELEEWTKRREFSVWEMAMGMLAASAQEQALNKEENSLQ